MTGRTMIWVCLFLVLVLAFACGGDDDSVGTGDTDTDGDSDSDAGYTIELDIVGDETPGAHKADPPNQENTPFTLFTKYEVEIYWLQYTAVDYETNESSCHYVLNRKLGDGVTIDLANECLSDVLTPEELTITDAIGNGFGGVQIGFGRTATVNGYLFDQDGTLLHTTAEGPVAGDGEPEDYELPVISSIFNEGLWPEDPPEGMVVPLNQDISVVSLAVFNIAGLLGLDPVTVEEGEVLQFRFPLDVGAQFHSGEDVEWTSVDVNVAAPYMESSMEYEKYYYRHTDFPYYTELLKLLFDSNSLLVDGQGQGIPYIDMGGNNATPLHIFYMSIPFQDAPDEQIIEDYWTMFGINEDDSIYFRYDNTEAGDALLYVPSFFRTEVGVESETTFYVDEVPVPITYVRVE